MALRENKEWRLFPRCKILSPYSVKQMNRLKCGSSPNDVVKQMTIPSRRKKAASIFLINSGAKNAALMN